MHYNLVWAPIFWCICGKSTTYELMDVLWWSKQRCSWKGDRNLINTFDNLRKRRMLPRTIWKKDFLFDLWMHNFEWRGMRLTKLLSYLFRLPSKWESLARKMAIQGRTLKIKIYVFPIFISFFEIFDLYRK